MLLYRKWAAVLGRVSPVMTGNTLAQDCPDVAGKVAAYSGEALASQGNAQAFLTDYRQAN